MKPFVILISPSNMEGAIQKFKEAGFDGKPLINSGTEDCIGNTETLAIGAYWYDLGSFPIEDCRHFTESQLDECIKWLKE